MSNRKRKNHYNNRNHENKGRSSQSQQTRNLANATGHGFQEYKDIEELNKFFSDPDNVPPARFEPPLFKKPSTADLSRSQGKR